MMLLPGQCNTIEYLLQLCDYLNAGDGLVLVLTENDLKNVGLRE
ncbi:MAG: hypothetical protein ACPG7F_12240 [Aggregatilineales bacterium]